VIRTVDEANASELETVVRQYLDARAMEADRVNMNGTCRLRIMV
jgi:hypothetical protein